MSQATNERDNRALWNVGGAVAGVLLAFISILGIVSSQTGVAQPQNFAEVIPYNG